MEYITGKKDFKLDNTIVTIGKFDCFHRGHQLLFKIASVMKQPEMTQVIFSFASNPSDVVNNVVGRHIVSANERHYQAVKNGVDIFIEYPFDDDTRNMTPDEFAKDVLAGKLGAKAVVAGDDFRFGKDRAGDTDTLKELGKKYGFEVRIVNRISYKGNIISSTYIREELLKGNLKDVEEMLGRPFTMSGTIGSGHHIGTGMGIPTINFSVPEDKLLPPDGVYATKTHIGVNFYTSITNIGVRPTFYEDGERFVETNILDFNGDIYGRKAVVSFHRFIRPEKRFAGKEELAAQIRKDIEEAREYFVKED